MLKNIFLLGIISWVGLSYSEVEIKPADLEDSQNYKLDKGIEETVNKRSLAGSKIKKNRLKEDEFPELDQAKSEDSEVRFWEYSE